MIELNALVDWMAGATPGETIVYHRGFLARDRDKTVSELSASDRQKLNDVADRAYAVCRAGVLALVQHRHAKADYSYIAIRTGAPYRLAQ